MPTIQMSSTDELIITLENNPTFHRHYHACAQRLLPGFFNTVQLREGRSLILGTPAPSQALYMTPGNVITNAIRPLIETAMRQLNLIEPGDHMNPLLVAAAYFSHKLSVDIQRGDISLDGDTFAALQHLYQPGQSVAAVCRQHKLTRHAVNTLRRNFPEMALRRYKAVQLGIPYASVMSDCVGFIHDQPAFNPVIQERGEGTFADVEAGDLVAPWGDCENWFVAGSDAGTSLVATTMPEHAPMHERFIHRPCRVLKKEHAIQLQRIGGYLNATCAT